jgi:hypothetical protein
LASNVLDTVFCAEFVCVGGGGSGGG